MGDEVDCNPIHVYVVDNEKLIASTLAVILTQNGYRAIGFTNSLEALKSAMAQPPAILISDVAMQDMNGIELAIEFQARFPRCKVLLLSGKPSTTDLLYKAKQRGYDFAVVAKPIHPSELLAAISNLVA
jgi:DNA-binding response OmpR family regulator